MNLYLLLSCRYDDYYESVHNRKVAGAKKGVGGGGYEMGCEGNGEKRRGSRRRPENRGDCGDTFEQDEDNYQGKGLFEVFFVFAS